MFYRYTAPNRERCYGWTTSEAVAEAALEDLNRDGSGYSMEAIGNDPDTRDGEDGCLLRNWCGLLTTDDTTLDDFEKV